MNEWYKWVGMIDTVVFASLVCVLESCIKKRLQLMR